MKSVNFKFLFALLVVVVMAFSVSACGGGEAGADDSSGSDAAATEAPAAGGDVVAAYVFTNTGTVEICELYLSAADQNDWGPDQLQSQTIAVGGEFTLKNIPAGLYDAKAVGCNGGGEAIGQLDIQNP
jgi:hypothetical protein